MRREEGGGWKGAKQRKITKIANSEWERKKDTAIYYREIVLSRPWTDIDDREINWLLSAVHRYTAVITFVYVNRRVKSEFNTIINRYVIALKCTRPASNTLLQANVAKCPVG